MANEDDARRVLDEHADRLTRLPNVVGVGLVEASEEGEGGESAVAVYVSSKVPEAQLKPSEVVPRTLTATVRGARVNVPTRVIEVGDITR